MFWRYDREVLTSFPEDADLAAIADTAVGMAALPGYTATPQDSVAPFGSCLALTLFDGSGISRSQRRVRVKLRPYDQLDDGTVALGKTYVSTPTIRTVDISLQSPAARRELDRIGCGPVLQVGTRRFQ